MTILNIASVNVDHFYRVTRHPAAGETVLDKGYLRGIGGKGTNMSLAAAAAGADVRQAGAIGQDGLWVRDRIADAGVDISDMVVGEVETGQGLIFVDDDGENMIVVHSGANHAQDLNAIKGAIARAKPGDWLLLQNETNLVAEAARAGRVAGLRIAYAAAPFDPEPAGEMLGLSDLVAVNEVEAAQLAENAGCPVEDLGVPALLVTMGSRGARYLAGGQQITTPAFQVTPVDTTGAGDTFLGFFLAGLDRGDDPAAALRRASAAGALQVTRPGAGDAIPSGEDVDTFLAKQQ